MEQKPGITQTEDILNSILPPRCEARAESGLDGGAQRARARAPERTFPKRARQEGAWPLRWQARARQAALEP